MKLPRGIWYEAPKKRYRVRLYRNKVPFLAGYYKTLEEAEEALQLLKQHLATVPKLPKRKRGSGSEAPVQTATLTGLKDAMNQRRAFDPNVLKRKQSV